MTPKYTNKQMLYSNMGSEMTTSLISEARSHRILYAVGDRVKRKLAI